MVITKKILDTLLSIYVLPMKVILKHSGDAWERRVIARFMKKAEPQYTYAQVRYYPKRAKQISDYHGISNNFSDCAIIIQGPIITEDDFTLETIKLYISYYPQAKIIVSTWENCDEKFEREIGGLDIELVKNKYPTINGVGNINYQLVSSLNGIRVAEKMNVDYVWKTRSDQRYYHPFALEYLRIKAKNSPEKIICLGGVRNSFSNRCFQLSDFMVFGAIKKVKIYCSCTLDDEDSTFNKYTHKNQNQKAVFYNKYISEVNKAEINGHIIMDDKIDDALFYYRNPEVILLYNYYCRVCKSDTRVEDSYKKKYDNLLKYYVDIVDAEEIGFFWKKYELQYVCESYFERMGKLDRIRYVVENDER